MRKILVSMFLLVFGIFLVGCDTNNNVKKPTIDMLYSDWYNCAKLPSMEDPFAELYDGCYTIKIDESNDVSFKSINQEQLNGILEYEEKEYTIGIKITFENNEKVNGNLRIINDSPYLQFFYEGINYCFTKSNVISKEDFELYRNDFNKFLRDSFINNNYPSIEEVENNSLYREYTNFVHIDPCCNGPKRYISVSKVAIASNSEKGEIVATYTDGKIKNINVYDIENIVLVKLDGTFERLKEIREGQCFLTKNCSLFYFECEHYSYGEYDNTRLYSKYPMYATQEVVDDNLKFTFTYAFKVGVNSCVVSLDDIVSDLTLQELFNAPVSDDVLKEDYVALFFVRYEGISDERLRDVTYSDLEIINGEINVSITYKEYITEGDTAIMSIEELILIPKEWTASLNQISNFKVNYKVTNK